MGKSEVKTLVWLTKNKGESLIWEWQYFMFALAGGITVNMLTFVLSVEYLVYLRSFEISNLSCVVLAGGLFAFFFLVCPLQARDYAESNKQCNERAERK